jgi:hypothetical protein
MSSIAAARAASSSWSMTARSPLPIIAAIASISAPATLRLTIGAAFLMDYAHRARLKIYAHVETLELDADPALIALVTMPGYRARLERIFRLHLAAFDWNCRQHITPRFTEQEIAAAVQPLRDRVGELETENAELRARFANHGDEQ